MAGKSGCHHRGQNLAGLDAVESEQAVPLVMRPFHPGQAQGAIKTVETRTVSDDGGAGQGRPWGIAPVVLRR
jgi:hypothetical protein